MSSSDLAAFGLSHAPFSKEIVDRDLWLPASKERIVDDLVAAAHAHAHVLLTGEPGVGKTCVLRALRHRLSQQGFRLTYCHNATLGRRDFYRQICLTLGLAPSATAAAVFYAISSHVEDLAKEQVHPVFLLDEAHLLHQDVLDHLHVLANYEWDSRALLSLFLIGLPELHTRLAMRRNRSLHSRVHHRFEIDASSPDDTIEYVRHRMRLAGADREIFTSDAIAFLHETASGALRDIDRLADAALRDAARRKKKLVERDSVLRVAGDRARGGG
jgi:type II secretory pathway predicted ATPase ExeA